MQKILTLMDPSGTRSREAEVVQTSAPDEDADLEDVVEAHSPKQPNTTLKRQCADGHCNQRLWPAWRRCRGWSACSRSSATPCAQVDDAVHSNITITPFVYTQYDKEMSCANPEPLVALEPRNIFFAHLRVLECANAGNVPLWTACCLHTRRPLEDCHLLVADLLSSTQKKCDYVSGHLSQLQDAQVFHLLSSFHHDCQIPSRQESSR